MNHRKAFLAGLLAAVAVMALASTASATTLTSPTGTAYTGALKLTSTNLVMEGPFVTYQCGHAALEGEVESHGALVPAAGKFSGGSFTSCNYATTVTSPGSFEIHSNGALTWTGLSLTLHTSVGTCVYTTNGTTLGTITGGSNAVLDITAKIPRTGGNFLCGSSMQWTGSYAITTPSTLVVD